MKRTYIKPVLYAEAFALAEHIAQACVFVTNFGNNCPIEEAGMTFFNTTPSCSEDAISMMEFAGVSAETATVEQLMGMNIKCYNSFRDFNTLFTSA